jgi:hypothetical protein
MIIAKRTWELFLGNLTVPVTTTSGENNK